ncbi:NTP transferase domain-containing protein [Aeoliella sp. SH292]|uniref:NTP transferase domain-containing protein n=1 Tax=Aeoliella sp. SH292 TaxID=3454464 RepID=UPI003F9E1FE0
MKNQPTLVIMAAGAARRYGGLKQLAPVGPSGEAIMEYSIHDAQRAGFGKVVLVVRREFESAFCEKFVDRASTSIDIALAYQEPNAFVPAGYQGAERVKPWGTAHAVLCAKPEVAGPFAVINADDFYGQSAFAAIGGFLGTLSPSDSSSAAMVGYALDNTLSDHGTVNRGVCEVDADGQLVNIVERFNIGRANSAAQFELDGAVQPLPLDTVVSMNLWGYPTSMMSYLAERFDTFLAAKPDPAKEYELPTVTKQLMADGALTVRVLPTGEQWCGMTYQDDLPIAQARVAELVGAGVYPGSLW